MAHILYGVIFALLFFTSVTYADDAASPITKAAGDVFVSGPDVEKLLKKYKKEHTQTIPAILWAFKGGDTSLDRATKLLYEVGRNSFFRVIQIVDPYVIYIDQDDRYDAHIIAVKKKKDAVYLLGSELDSNSYYLLSGVETFTRRSGSEAQVLAFEAVE